MTCMAYKTDKLKRYIAISHDSTGLFEVKHTLWGQANLRESCQSDPVNIDTMVGGGGGGQRNFSYLRGVKIKRVEL